MLPLEAKETKFANKPKPDLAPPSTNTMSELEKLRQQKGRHVEPSNDDSTFAMPHETI